MASGKKTKKGLEKIERDRNLEKEGQLGSYSVSPHVESLIYIQSALCELLIGL